MNSETVIGSKINTAAVKTFIEGCVAAGTAPRAMGVLKGGETVLKLGFAPYKLEEPMYLYSLSKPFTSVAVGICCDRGLLSPETKMCELFPDKMPPELTEGLKKLTLDDLLTMRCGHGRCVIEEMRWADDALKCFFAFPMQFEPGATFVYSTAATCVAAAAVERVTGMRIEDFIYENLFRHLGLGRKEWRVCGDGTCLGGTGLLLDVESVMRFGQMLLQNGVYNGKRIVSADYLALATEKHTDSYVGHVSKDWSSGYGFQFWRNGRGGFRGDGAYGQICMVLPDEDTVFVFFCESFDSVAEFALANSMLDSLFTPGENDPDGLVSLAQGLYPAPRGEAFEGALGFGVAENAFGITAVRFAPADGGLELTLTTRDGEKRILCGDGKYIENRLDLRGFDVTQVPDDPALARLTPFPVHASYARSGGTIALTLRHIDTCHTQVWTFDTERLVWKCDPRCGRLSIREFTLLK